MGFSLNAYAGAAAGGEFILQPGVSAASSAHVGLFAPVGLDLALVRAPASPSTSTSTGGAT